MVNQDGTFSDRVQRVAAYLTIQIAQFAAGFVSANNPATFVATLIINAIYLSFFSLYIDNFIKNGERK